MTNLQKYSLVLLRLSLGWLFFYSGITKILNPAWSAAGYLKGAKTFISFYQWLLTPSVLPVINFLNEWGLTLVGVSLILGVFVRWGSYAGILLMVLYYLPILQFPMVGDRSYIVDEHIIYIFAFLILAGFDAGKTWGLENRISAIFGGRKTEIV